MEELLKKAAIIRDETDDGENTAERVGELFVDILQKIALIIPFESIDGESLSFVSNENSVKLSFVALDGNGQRIQKEVDIPVVSSKGAGIISTEQFLAIQSSIEDALKKVITEKQSREEADNLLMRSLTAISDKIGQAGGIASLDDTGKLPVSQINFGETENTVFDGKRGLDLESKASILRTINYDSLDTTFAYGLYTVGDSDALLYDMMLISSYGEAGHTMQLLISSSNKESSLGIRFRTHDSEKWSEWSRIDTTFEDAVDNGYIGTREEFYESLSELPLFSSHIENEGAHINILSNPNIDEIFTSGLYLCNKFINEQTLQQYYLHVIGGMRNGYMQIRYSTTVIETRTYKESKWSEWEPVGGGSGSGFYNVTLLHPLASGYYNKATAVAALSDAGIKDKDKPGMIITIETSSGKWDDYRFSGTDIDTFLEPASWERHGGADAVKGISVNGIKQEQDATGNVNLSIEKIEIDASLDANSINAVQNAPVAAKFSEVEANTVFSLDSEVDEENNTVKLSLKNKSGAEIASTEFQGGTGGGVEPGTSTKIVLNASVNNTIIKEGGSSLLTYFYDHQYTSGDDKGMSTGQKGDITIQVLRGAQTVYSATVNDVSKGTYTFDLSKYLLLGTTDVYVRATTTDPEGKKQTKQAYTSVKVVTLSLLMIHQNQR